MGTWNTTQRALTAAGTLAVFAGALMACGGDNAAGSADAPNATSPANTATAGPETEPTDAAASNPDARSERPRFGVGGMIPPHFPDASDSDWQRLFASFAETGELVGVYTGWFDDPSTKGAIPEVVQLGYRLDDVVPVVAIGVTREVPGGVEPTLNFSDAEQRAQFVDTVSAIAQEYHPEYLAVGGEVNRLWEQDPVAFDGFVALYVEAYDAIKAASPETRVFTIFQLEMLMGEAYLTGEEHEPAWELVERFGERLDLVGFTTYPYFDYETPGAVPSDYYQRVAERVGRPIALTEVGWPSRPLPPAPQSGYGGSPEEQAAFVERLDELLESADVEIAVWAFPYDLDTYPTFESVALRRSDGTPKPALAAWQALAGVN